MNVLKTILVAEDSQMDRKIINDALVQDYTLVFVENGVEALEYLEREYLTVAIILLDIVMPIMDGYELLKNLRTNGRYSNIPAIVMTNNDDTESEDKALELGATDFITKPYRKNVIKKKVNNLISLRKAYSIVEIISKDFLPGISNQQAFYQKAADRLLKDKNREYDMIAIDVERFKLINDTYGINEGNKVLKYIASILSDFVKFVDGECGRISGDNFMFLYPRKQGYVERMAKEVQKNMG